MKRINLLYEYDYDDVDILLVPDEIADNIDAVMWEFKSWLEKPMNHSRFLIMDNKGKYNLNIDTEEFLWWINNVRIKDGTKATIVSQHGPWQKEYPTVDF